MRGCHKSNMTPEQTRLLASFSLAAIAAGAGLSVDMIRDARDDATAPQAEIAAAALRRVWLWGLGNMAPSRSAAALAAGVSRPTVRRAVEAVEAWSERDAEVADKLTGVAELLEALACALTEGGAVMSAATQ